MKLEGHCFGLEVKLVGVWSMLRGGSAKEATRRRLSRVHRLFNASTSVVRLRSITPDLHATTIVPMNTLSMLVNPNITLYLARDTIASKQMVHSCA